MQPEPNELQPVEFIYDHVWRPHTIRPSPGYNVNDCIYMNCRKPKTVHMRAVGENASGRSRPSEK